jgi:hypothetical protein
VRAPGFRLEIAGFVQEHGRSHEEDPLQKQEHRTHVSSFFNSTSNVGKSVGGHFAKAM